jgi:transmembrane sensor
MSEVASNSPSSIAAEAADWYARLRASNVSELDAVRFRAWIASDPARRREFEAIDAFWEDLGAIENSPEVLREREAITRRRAPPSKLSAEPSVSTRIHTRKIYWTAAAALLLVTITVFWIQQQTADRYITGVGEQRTVPLADGSVVTLNTSTEIRLDYSPDRRGVDLVSGQANFEVAKDANRPFVVTAGGSEVRAVGTQFDVYKTADKVTVTLIEGKVAVKETSGAAGAAPGEINLSAGEQLSYITKTGSVQRGRADLPRASAWRARKLDFSDTPLRDAIAEANRYSPIKVELRAPELETARISGSFEAGKNELFVEGLQSYFKLNVERESDQRIVLTVRRDQPLANSESKPL